LIPFKTIPNHSWEVSRTNHLAVIVSWSPELWTGNEKNQAKSSTALINTKTSLLHDIESIDSNQKHPKSSMGCIKRSCDE
jgi:hypothetical protein